MNLQKEKKEELELPFRQRALSALGVSIVADALDYFVAPIFAMPIIGDIADGIITATLYSITKSKTATAINTIEFIPVIGDLVPVYTLSTLIWICQESIKRRRTRRKSDNYQDHFHLNNNRVKDYHHYDDDGVIKATVAKRYVKWRRANKLYD
jgi:hypothetical protein